MIIEDSNFLTSNQKDFIHNIVCGNNFPFYLQNESVRGDSKSLLTHNIILRPEDRGEEYLNSTFHTNDFIDILKTFCIKHFIPFNEILRLSVNLTFNNGNDKCPLHIDHPGKKHNQLIIYCNDVLDKNSKTVICDKDNKEVKEVIPEIYKGICFTEKPHYHYFPKQGHRIVLVYTWI